jgi:HSP20 family protein
MGITKMFSDFDQFDLLFKNFFEVNSIFEPISGKNIYYPVDIRESSGDLVIDIAVVGINKEEIKIKVEDGNVLRVIYDKPEEMENANEIFITKRITRKSFNFGWRVSNKFDLGDIDAKMENGLLTIVLKKVKGSDPKTVEIK